MDWQEGSSIWFAAIRCWFSPWVTLLIGASQHPTHYKGTWKKEVGVCSLKGEGYDSVWFSALETPDRRSQKWILIFQKETFHKYWFVE